MTETGRCIATKTLIPAALLNPIIALASKDQPSAVRCQRAPHGPEVQHRASVTPFPGFADQVVTWDDEVVMIIKALDACVATLAKVINAQEDPVCWWNFLSARIENERDVAESALQ